MPSAEVKVLALRWSQETWLCLEEVTVSWSDADSIWHPILPRGLTRGPCFTTLAEVHFYSSIYIFFLILSIKNSFISSYRSIYVRCTVIMLVINNLLNRIFIWIISIDNILNFNIIINLFYF